MYIDAGHIDSATCGMSIPARFAFQDKKDIEFACRAGVDWIAMSFVQTKDDMKELRERVQNHGFDEIPGCNNTGLIAQENPTHSGKISCNLPHDQHHNLCTDLCMFKGQVVVHAWVIHYCTKVPYIEIIGYITIV